MYAKQKNIERVSYPNYKMKVTIRREHYTNQRFYYVVIRKVNPNILFHCIAASCMHVENIVTVLSP